MNKNLGCSKIQEVTILIYNTTDGRKQLDMTQCSESDFIPLWKIDQGFKCNTHSCVDKLDQNNNKNKNLKKE